MNGAVPVCFDKDVACGEVHPKNRCAHCPLQAYRGTALTKREIKLLPCPFCGGAAEFERMGTARVSCIVTCTQCGAYHEGPDEGDRSGAAWNHRADRAQATGAIWHGSPRCPFCNRTDDHSHTYSSLGIDTAAPAQKPDHD